MLAVAGEINAASIELQTQNGTAAGVQSFRHHLRTGRSGRLRDSNTCCVFPWEMKERQ